MADVLPQIEAFFAELGRRISRVINFRGMTNERWLRVLMIVCTYLLIRPWLVKLGNKITESEYGKMEARDKERMAKEQAEREQEAAVNTLRGKKPAANDIGTTTATDGEVEATHSLTERARDRAQRAAEIQKIMAADKRAAELENWDQDDEFLQNFAKSSDRSYAAR